VLEPAHFSECIGRSLESVERIEAELRSAETLREPLARVEAWLLRRALEANQNQRTPTARQLGITREGLYKERPTLTGIAKVLRNRGLAGLARECSGASERQ
jgi:DNA-binding NtrC family response regulator